MRRPQSSGYIQYVVSSLSCTVQYSGFLWFFLALPWLCLGLLLFALLYCALACLCLPWACLCSPLLALACLSFVCIALSLLVHLRNADGTDVLTFLFCVGKASQSLCLLLLACLCSPLLACLCLPLLACLCLLACACPCLCVSVPIDQIHV